MTDVVLGIDGGGTKTDVAVASLDGTTLSLVRTGPTNWEGVGLEAMFTTLEAGVAAALDRAEVGADRIAAAVFALAGCDWPSDAVRLESELARLQLPGTRSIVNDSFAALRAGTSRPYGVVSIAGTGGCTSGRGPDGKTARTMAVNWGEGSGAWSLVRGAAEAMAREHHGHASTKLTPKLLEALGFEAIPDFFEALTRGRRTTLGSQLAPLVLDIASDGDAVAQRIVADVARQHAQDVIGVARRLGLLDDSFEVVCSGGVHRAGHRAFDLEFRAVTLAAAPRAEFVQLHDPPVLGALLLGLDAIDGSTPAPRGRLVETLARTRTS
jgi:N-acetylglucosamine kinase-like BadF-type ATPase